ncbi:MAG: hypothetical protein QXI49_01270 [Candidatus Methanomethylicaceae archaeon]
MRTLKEIVSLVLIIGGLINICYILSSYINFFEVYNQCGNDSIIPLQPNFLSILPFNYVIIFIGLYRISSPYVKYLFKKFSKEELKALFHHFINSSSSFYSCGGKYCIRFYNKDLVLHNIFSELAYVIYNKRPTTISIKNSYLTQLYSKRAMNEKFKDIMEESKDVKKEFIRLLMSSEGWITCFFLNNKIYPKIGLGSTISYEKLKIYNEVTSDFGMKFNIHLDSRYGNKGFLTSSSYNTLNNFIKIGGFVEGVTIKKGIFKGIEKNSLANTIIKLKDKKFENQEEVIDTIKLATMDDTLKIYLYRLMLG